MNGCAFMRECHRVLEKDGRLILFTSNISTFFTMALLLAGKMPSSGPHPDSNVLLAGEEVFKVSSDAISNRFGGRGRFFVLRWKTANMSVLRPKSTALFPSREGIKGWGLVLLTKNQEQRTD